VETSARYDGIADYYDEHLRAFTLGGSEVLRTMLGRGPGRCLDLGCGGGLHFDDLLELGWTVTGVDVSADQLRVARARAGGTVELVHADASSLPFPDASFDAVAAVFVHTDLPDYRAVVAEAVRVLRSGGRFVHLGLHPCFVGPFSRYQGAAEPPLLFSGYRQTGWTDDAPGFGEGLRREIGAWHLPLAELLNALLDAGLRLDRLEEPGEHEFPRILAVAATRP
jgi:SAM-dependent methyltransferase